MRPAFAYLFWVAVVTVTIPARPAAATEIHDIPVSDPRMQAAIRKAQATLPQFWRTFENPQPHESNFSVYIGLEEDGVTEYVWLLQIERSGDQVSGVISGEVKKLTGFSNGDRVTVSQDAIVDWTFSRKGKMAGNETLRPVIKEMSPIEAKAWLDLLEDP